MEEEKFDRLKKEVVYINEEFLTGNQEARLYRNADELINAIRNNEVPGIPWTEEDERKWQLEEAYNASLETKPEWIDDNLAVIDNEMYIGSKENYEQATRAEWKQGKVEEFFEDIFEDEDKR